MGNVNNKLKALIEPAEKEQVSFSGIASQARFFSLLFLLLVYTSSPPGLGLTEIFAQFTT